MDQINGTVTLHMPEYELRALAQFVKHIEYDTVVRHSRCCVYGRRQEADVMWSALRLLRRQLAQAGFAPR